MWEKIRRITYISNNLRLGAEYPLKIGRVKCARITLHDDILRSNLGSRNIYKGK